VLLCFIRLDIASADGTMAEWLRSGLQIRVPRL